MSEQNIVNVMVIPDVPKVLPGEQLYVYVPKASFTFPGIIAYNNTQFRIDGNFLFIREDYVSPGVQQKIDELKQYTDDELQLKQDKEDNNISLAQRPEQKSVVGAINDLGTLTQEAKNAADHAQSTADNATTLANTGISKAEQAQQTADNAQQAADAAQATADNATILANTGISKADGAQTTANTAVDKANDAKATAQEAIMKADGRATSIGFMTAKDAVTALNGYPRNQLKGGDTIWIVEDGTPDLWVTEVAQESVPYNYTTKDKFNQDLVDNKVLQIGYFKTAYQESDGKPVTIAWQNVLVKSTDWVASTEFADFPYEARIELTDFVDYTTVPQVVFDIADTMSGNYAPICKSGDKCVYIYGKVQNEITLKTVITFAPNVNGASITGGGYNNRGKWQASTTYEIDDLVYTDNGQYVCIEGITSTTSPEQDATHWQATFVANVPVKSVNGQTGAVTIDVPTKTSQLTNDSGFITANDIPDVPDTPTALPQEAVAVKSGSLPTSGWITPEEGWIENTLPANSMWWSVIYGNGKFVAVARDSTNGAYSMDGITWTAMTLPASRDWKSVTYGNDKFVVVASGSANGAYSTDGINWTEMTLPASQSWQSVTYGDGKYVAVASDKSDKGAYSTDGITWTQMSMSISQSWQSVTYGDGKFVAVAYNSKKGAYSTDGITWTEMTLTAGHNWRITYGNDKFVAVAVDWNDGAYSTDGITWTKMFMPESKFWSSVTYGDGKFVAVASDSNKVAYSTDGINWTGMSMPAGHNGVSVAYGDGKFVAVSSGVNGVYWNVAAKQVTYVISDASVTANSDVLMELTDDGGVKASALTNGSIEVIRDTVPTQPIPYTYKVKQTNASGQFTLINHYVAGVTSVNGQTGEVTIAVPTKTSELTNDSNFATTADIPTKTSQLTNDSGFLTTADIPTKTSELENDSGFITASDIPTIPTNTSQLTNDSGFVKTSEANTFTAEQTFSNANGIKANKVRNLNGNEWYNFDGNNDKFGNTTTPTIIRTSEARPKAEVPSGSATVTKEIALLEDIPSAGEWVELVSTSYEDKTLVRKFVFPDISGDLEGKSVEVVYEPQTYGMYTRVLSFGVISLPKGGTATDNMRTVSGFCLRTSTEETETNPVSNYIQVDFRYVFDTTHGTSSITVTAFTSLKGDTTPSVKYRKIN